MSIFAREKHGFSGKPALSGYLWTSVIDSPISVDKILSAIIGPRADCELAWFCEIQISIAQMEQEKFSYLQIFFIHLNMFIAGKIQACDGISMSALRLHKLLLYYLVYLINSFYKITVVLLLSPLWRSNGNLYAPANKVWWHIMLHRPSVRSYPTDIVRIFVKTWHFCEIFWIMRLTQ